MVTREEAEQGNEELQEEIQGILWWMFRADQGPGCQVKNVAPEMNIAPDTLNKYIRGVLPLPFYHGAGLYRATGDRMLLDWLLRRCPGLALVELKEHQGDGDIGDELDRLMCAVFGLYEEKVKSLRDGKLTEKERGKLYRGAVETRARLDEFIQECTVSRNK